MLVVQNSFEGSGTVLFVPILTIDDDSMPEDIFFENASDGEGGPQKNKSPS